MKHPKIFYLYTIIALSISFVNLSYSQPECTFLLEPQNQTSFVNISTDLIWQASGGATGYILRVGTTPGGGEIMDDIDVGNVTTHDPGDFPCASTIYVTITPYDGFNTPPICDQELFETEYATASTSSDVVICEGMSIQVYASGGTEYEWSPAGSLNNPYIYNPTASPLETTTYTVTVTNVSGCTDTDQLTVYVSPTIYANASATAETCNNCYDGTATANPTGGTPTYMYEWSNGQYGQTINYLSPGQYTVTVTDIYGCTAIETVTVDEFICPTLSIDETVIPTCYNQCNGTIIVTDVINGTPPYEYLWSNGGSSTNALFDLCPAFYGVIVTDAYNCTVTEDFEIIENGEIFPGASATDETCYGCNDGTATANPSGGTPPYYYYWTTTGSSEQTITNLIPGSYEVQVSDTYGCYSLQTVEVNEFICPILTIEETLGGTCYGLCSGFISIFQITNGIPPFTYEWSNGETTNSIYSLCPGPYQVTVTDSKNCTVSKEYDITEYSQVIANESSTDETCLGCNNGTATVNPSGGTPGYWYNWSNGESTQTITDLAPGSYTVTVGDINECFVIETVTVNEFICPTMVIDDDKYDVNCYGDCDGEIYINSVSNTIGTLMYEWNDGSNGSFLSDLCPGNYSVTVTDISMNCSVSKSYSITEPTQLMNTMTKTDESCNGCEDGTATANPSGGTPSYWYVWSNGDETQTVTGLAPGTYNVTIGDAHECILEESVIINEFGCPVMEIQEDLYNVNCYDECDGSISITNVTNTIGTLMYEWNDGSNGSQITDLCAGNYSVTVTDISINCSVSKSYTISEPSQLMNTMDKTDESCNGCEDGSATANPSGGTPDYWYVWSNGEETQTITGLAPGSFTVTIGDAHECIIEETVVIDEYGCPNMIIEDDVYNVSCFEKCDGYIAITNISNTIGTLMYLWNDGSNGSQITNLCPGTYSVTITDISLNCSVSKSYTITQPSQLENTLTKTDETCTGCNDGSATATPNGGTPNYWYVWSNGEETQTINNLVPGTYSVTVGDAHECIIEQSITIDAFGCPNMVIEENINEISCFGQCDASISITNVTNTIGTLMYLWNDGSNGSQLTGLCPGEYSVTVTDISNNCSTTKSYTITQPSQLINTLTKTDETCTGCNDGSATATLSGGTPNYWYQWSNGASTQTISNLTPGTYSVTVGDSHECIIEESITIEAFECPNMIIEDNLKNVVCFGKCDGSISITAVTNTIGTLMYTWNDGSNGSQITGLCPGSYSVTVTDITNNCTVTKTYNITESPEIIITVVEKVNPIGNTKGKIDIDVNNDGTYTFTWTGPNGFSANTEDIDNLDEGCYTLIIANDHDCSKETTICLEKETGILDPNYLANTIKIFPNPTNDYIDVNLEQSTIQNGLIEIYDLSGQKIITHNIDSKNIKIDLSSAKQGVYIAKINNSEYLIYKKIIVSK